jgi:hypothetical protein
LKISGLAFKREHERVASSNEANEGSRAMMVLNFSHPITMAQREAISNFSGYRIEMGNVKDVNTQFYQEKPFAEQAAALVESVGLSSEQWQTARILVNLPSLNTIAALLLAEMHGRMGYFPSVIRLRPVIGSAPPQFEAVEILNLQAMRDEARARR